MSDTHICTQCGCEISEEDHCEINGNILCSNCYDEETASCSCCGERIWNDVNNGNEETILCSTCYDRYYTNCEQCSCLIHADDAYYSDDDDDSEQPYCRECYERNGNGKYIHDYGYKPDPIFYGEGIRFYGAELEVDNGGKISENALKLLDTANKQSEYIYIKGDGSLDDGLEIVTHPMTLAFHTNQMPWQELLSKAAGLGYRSHTTSTCGFHIHVGRKSFGLDMESQEVCISRILFFVERFWQELLRFSRRTEYQVKRWAARYGYQNCPKEILDHAKKGCQGRYTCVNITNFETIEFRIFRGTLKYNTLIATLQMVDEICNMAILMSDEELTALSWCDFMEGIDAKKSPELIAYLKERRLYVNEPVEEKEVEI